jgi:hypothetical protein
VPALADLVRLVRLDPVHGVAVLVREDRDRLRAELVGGAKRTDRDLATIGHQHLAEHAANLSGTRSGSVTPLNPQTGGTDQRSW